jgi:hypothetical protein
MEKIVLNKPAWYAGTLDRTGSYRDGSSVILDIKTSSQIKDIVGMQLAAYAECLDYKPTRKVCVQLKPDGTYTIREFNERKWWKYFLVCKDFYNLKKEMGYEI